MHPFRRLVFLISAAIFVIPSSWLISVNARHVFYDEVHKPQKWNHDEDGYGELDTGFEAVKVVRRNKPANEENSDNDNGIFYMEEKPTPTNSGVSFRISVASVLSLAFCCFAVQYEFWRISKTR